MTKEKFKIRIPIGVAAVEVRADTLDEEQRTVEVIWSTGARVKRYSWTKGYYFEELEMTPDAIRLERFQAGMSFLDSHDSWSMSDRLGTVVPGSVKIEGGKGYATIKLSRKPRADELLQDLRDGHPLSISVGYKVHSYEELEQDDDQYPIMRAIDWEPMELSAVTIPADAGAQSRSEERETFECDVIRHVVDAADAAAPEDEDVGMKNNRNTASTGSNDASSGQQANDVGTETRNEQTGQVVNEPAGQSQERSAPQAPVDTDPQAPQPTPEEATRAAVAIERTRTNAIMEIGKRHGLPSEMITDAVSRGTSLDAFRGQVLDHLATGQESTETLPGVPAQARGGQDEVETRREAMANAMLHRARPGEHELTDAGRQYRAMSMLEMAKEAMEARGEKVRGLSKREIAERALQTTSDFPVVLGNVTNSILRRAYEAAPQTFRPFCTQVSATDFKDMARMQLGEVGNLVKIGENGEYKSTTIGEGKEKYRLATYGRIIGITRQVLINDDLGVFTNLAGKFGNAVSRLESDTVWGIFLNNIKMSDGNALFHTAHANLLTGASSALSETGLSAARVAMGRHKDIDKRGRLNIRPKFLLLPDELEVTAAKLLGMYSPTKTADVTPEFIRSLTPIIEGRLSDASTSAWYLAADPAQIDTIEYAYLEGESGPYTETRTGFDVDGMEIKVRLDFGAAPIDFRGLAKSTGQ